MSETGRSASALRVEPSRMRYRAMIGTGGIGSGVFFLVNGNETIGREESRGGRFLDRRDYCKLHIISHYVQTLLGPAFETVPVGMVGEDDVGAKLLAEMAEAGMQMRHVARSSGDPTLYSFCFVYPDGSGGNLTTDDSASSRVDAAFVQRTEPEFARYASAGIALAAPEVSLDARRAVLELGTRHRFLRVASFTAEEMATAVSGGLLEKCDLLAINVSEAAAAAGFPPGGDEPPDQVAAAAVERLSQANPRLLISITAGERGSWSWDGTSLVHVPRCQAPVVGTAGAGDAYLSGLIVGIAAGLELRDGHQLAALVAGLSVTSPHTINKEIGRESLRAFAGESGLPIGHAVRSLMEA
ncbi:MAG: carbohydrate kinase family protein [Armatimonadota bacterium]